MPTCADMAVVVRNETMVDKLPQPPFDIPIYLTVLVPTLYITVFLVGVLGNGLVIFVAVRLPDMRTSSNLYLASLSIADLLVLLICLPSGLAEFHTQEVWHLGDAMCRLVVFLENLASSASVLTIMAVSMDRYVAVCLPLRAQCICTNKRAVKVICSVWATATAAGIPFFMISQQDQVQYYDNSWRHVCATYINSDWKRCYVAFTLTCFFCLPFGLLLVVYIILGKKLYSDALSCNTRDPHMAIILRTRRQAVVMLVAIVLLFFTCLLPIRVLIFWQSFGSAEALKSLTLEGYLIFFNSCRLLFYANSACNPIVYGVVSRKYRRAFARVLYVCRQKHPLPPVRSRVVLMSRRQPQCENKREVQ